MKSWKQAQHGLLKKFDTDQDGSINIQEWEAVREAAQHQVDEEIKKQALEPGINIMMQPPDGRPFILSAEDEAKAL